MAKPQTPKNSSVPDAGADKPQELQPAIVGGDTSSPADNQTPPESGAVVPPEAPLPAEEQPAASVVVIGPPQGRWRCGRKFGKEPVTLPAADLSEDELAALQADPHLSVSLVDAPY